MTRHYIKGDLTVIWKSELCEHCTNCWKGLPEVFSPGKKPWINLDGADAERIIAQVKKCPSGSLSYVITDNKDRF